MTSERTHRAGASVEDHCRACKTDRLHTVIAADNEGRAIRVACGYCHSEHNYRGGPQVVAFGGHASAPRGPRVRGTSTAPFPIVSERERMAAPMTPVTPESDDLEFLLRRIIREEAGVTPATPEERWRGGTLVLRPGGAGGQEKSWPIETFFHKIVMVRNRLRTLEQQVNASDLPADVKVKMQGYVSGCYGSLTSFNVSHYSIRAPTSSPPTTADTAGAAYRVSTSPLGPADRTQSAGGSVDAPSASRVRVTPMFTMYRFPQGSDRIGSET